MHTAMIGSTALGLNFSFGVIAALLDGSILASLLVAPEEEK